MASIRNVLTAVSLSVLGLGAFAALDATLNPADAVITEFSDGSVYIDVYIFEDGSVLI